MRQIVVTGASGFIGAAVVRALGEAGEHVRAVVRGGGLPQPGAAAVFSAGDLAQRTSWGDVVGGAEVVLHLAARAHRSDPGGPRGLDEYRRVNRDTTLALAEAAARYGVRRFVFLSSIGVLGEHSGDRPFRASDSPRPEAPYAVSKAEAEDGLMELAARTGLEVVIIRPPLVCGPGAPGNLRRLLRVAASPWPLPLGAVRNRRTFAGLENLVDLLGIALDHPNAPGPALLVADDETVSTAELVAWMRAEMGRGPRLVRAPVRVLRRFAVMFGAAASFDKITGSLEVDNGTTKRRVGWTPRVPTRESVSEMTRAFLRSRA